MGLRATLENQDRRWIFLAVGIAVLAPLFFKVGFPIEPSPHVELYYNTIEALPDGSTIYLATDFSNEDRETFREELERTLRGLAADAFVVVVKGLD